MPSDRREPGTPGPPGQIPLSIPNIRGNEWQYVRECLETGWVSSVGGFVDRFERELATAVGARFGVATASGTAALHVALLVSGIEPGDLVLMPALTFIAPANAIRYAGAHPVFLDVDSRHAQLDPGAVERFLAESCMRSAGQVIHRATGRRVRGILPVDLLGHPADLGALRRLADDCGLVVVEDATESLGARYRGHPLGSVSRVTAFSFNGNKLLTTGGGGMLVTDDEDLARRARYLTTQAKDDPIEFVHGAVGYNYRLTNVQAAIGVAQLEQLGAFLSVKRRLAARYGEALAGLAGVTPMQEAPWAESAWWLYTMRWAPHGGPDSRLLIRRLEANGIQARPLWQPLHRSPAHRESPAGACPEAEAWYREAVSLPSSTQLTVAEQDRVIAEVRRAHGAAA